MVSRFSSRDFRGVLVLVLILLLVVGGLWFAGRGHPSGASRVSPQVEDREAAHVGLPASGGGDTSGRVPVADGVECGLQLEGVSGVPLAGVEVDDVDETGQLRHLVSDAEGHVVLARGGAHGVRLTGDGLVDEMRFMQVDGVKVIQMRPGGSVEVRVDMRGVGQLKGPEVALLPGRGVGRPWGRQWEAELDAYRIARERDQKAPREVFAGESSRERRRELLLASPGVLALSQMTHAHSGPVGAARGLSGVGSFVKPVDDSGTARWDSLPPGVGYAWGVVGPHRLEIQPAPPEGEDPYGPPFPTDLSGAFDLHAGSQLRFKGVALPSSSVSGAISPGARAWHDPVVTLALDVRTPGHELAGIDGGWLQVGEVSPGVDGSFEFQALEPARYRVKARWGDGALGVYFDQAIFELRPFESRVLAPFSASSGVDQTLEFRAEDLQGNALAATDLTSDPGGVPVTFALAFDSEAPPDAFDAVQASADAYKMWVLSSRVPGRISLHGIEPGSYVLSLPQVSVPGQDSPKRGARSWAFVSAPEGQVELELLGGEAEVVFRFREVLTLGLAKKLDWQKGEALPSLRGWWLSATEKSRRGSFTTTAESGGAVSSSVDLSLPEGDWTFYGQVKGARGKVEGVVVAAMSLHASGAVSLPDPIPSCAIQGRVPIQQGGPKSVVANLHPEGLGATRGGFAFADVNEDGEFLLEGLPPDTPVWIAPLMVMVRTGAPGSVVSLP